MECHNICEVVNTEEGIKYHDHDIISTFSSDLVCRVFLGPMCIRSPACPKLSGKFSQTTRIHRWSTLMLHVEEIILYYRKSNEPDCSEVTFLKSKLLCAYIELWIMA